MTRLCFMSFCIIAISIGIQGNASADILLNSGSASFNFDTDASGDFSLTRSGFPDVLENFDVHIRTRYGTPGSEVESVFSFGTGLTIQSAAATSPSSAQIVFNALLVPGSGIPSPGSDLLIPILNFGLTETTEGHAELQFTVTTIGVNFNDLGGLGTSTLAIDTFFLFEYESDSPAFTVASGIPAYSGATTLVGDSAGGGMLVLPGDATAVEISSSSDLTGDINTGSDFTTGGGSGANLTAGYQFTDSLSTVSFATINSATVVAIPEPSTSLFFYSVLAVAFGYLTIDSRRSRRKA